MFIFSFDSYVTKKNNPTTKHAQRKQFISIPLVVCQEANLQYVALSQKLYINGRCSTTYSHTHQHMCMHTPTHTCTHIRAHMHTYTHTHISRNIPHVFLWRFLLTPPPYAQSCTHTHHFFHITVPQHNRSSHAGTAPNRATHSYTCILANRMMFWSSWDYK